MVYNLHVEIPGDWPKGLHTRRLRNDNFTYNINALLRPTRWVDLTLRDLDGMHVWDAALVLNDVHEDWSESPRFFSQFAISSWGSLHDCMMFVDNLAAELRVEYDESGILRVS